jgi:hypothetical protein
MSTQVKTEKLRRLASRPVAAMVAGRLTQDQPDAGEGEQGHAGPMGVETFVS